MSTTQVTNDGLSSQDLNCTILVTASRSDNMGTKELKEAIEKGDVTARRHALECMIRMHLNGQPQNHMIMSVIKYITPMEDHLIKRLVLYFWEVVDKTDKDGKLLSEIILICNYLRNDLQHPNEYVRGLTLRFLCRVTDRDLVSPLVSSLDQNLKHRVAYVRRTAVLALHVIYRKFPDLLPHAPDLLEAFIRDETDVTARRNAFDMFAAFAPDRAAAFLQDFLDSHELSSAGAVFLMSAVEFCQQAIRANPQNKARYVPLLFAILQSKNAAVRFQCATTLLNLSSSPTAIRQALFIFIDILKTHSDNSVRLIVVDKLDAMRARFLPMLQRSLLDVLSALQSGTVEVRQKIVLLAQELVTSQNVEAFVQAMRKEMLRVQNELTQGSSVAAAAQDGGGAASLVGMTSGVAATLSATATYKLLILRAINRAVVGFPRVANAILPVLLDYICEPESPLMAGNSRLGGASASAAGLTTSSTSTSSSSTSSSAEVAALIKETLLVQPALRASTLARLIESFPLIQNAVVTRSVLWIFGAYASEAGEVLRVFDMLRAAMQPLPLTPPLVPAVDAEAAAQSAANGGGNNNNNNANNATTTVKAITTVREDGTYVTSYTTVANANGMNSAHDTEDGSATSGLRSAIVRGDYFLAAVLAGTLAKFVATLFQDGAEDNAVVGERRAGLQAEAEALVRELIRYGTDSTAPAAMDGDTQEHLQLCLELLRHPRRAFLREFLLDSRRAMEEAGGRTKEALLLQSHGVLSGAQKSAAHRTSAPSGAALTAIDSPIFFSQLTTGKDEAVCEPEANEEPDNNISNNNNNNNNNSNEPGSRDGSTLSKATEYLRKIEEVIPLSGFEDAIYCEASVTVNRFDVSVNWQLMNKTAATFQNVSIELASLGGMRLLERPQSYTLGPYAVIKVRTPLKSSATETGIVFGSLLYDSQDGTRHYYSALVDIHVDIMNYVKPAVCTAAEFRDKWRAYDWENKINVSTDRYGLLAYVSHIARELNMYLLDVLPEEEEAEEEEENNHEHEAGEEEEDESMAVDENKKGSRPPIADKEDCEYISCNLYARTIFNEDALANISIERDARGKITGVIRIRSNTQSVAYGIGEKINMLDKTPADTTTAAAA